MKKYTFLIILSLITIFGCKSTQQQKNRVVNFPVFSAEAHRGGRGLMPENTIIAMQHALTMDNITTLEMDTHVTKDNQVVVTHAEYLSPAFTLKPHEN